MEFVSKLQHNNLLPLAVLAAGVALGAGVATLHAKREAKREHNQQEQARAAAQARKERFDADEKKRREHAIAETTNEYVKCSCGVFMPDRHHYNLHVEQYSHLKPADPTGWPVRQFETVPYLNKAQRGVVAKGNIPYAVFSTIKLKPGFDDASVRSVLSTVPEITKAVSEIDKEARLVSVVAVDAELWASWDAQPPSELKKFEPKICKSSKEVMFPATGGHIFLLAKATRVDLAYEVGRHLRFSLGQNVAEFSQVVGFAYMGANKYGVDYARDFSGFIDGTRNPDHLLRALCDEVLIFPDDESSPQTPHAGGSYMWGGRFVHNLQKFFSMTDEEKSHVIGRSYTEMEPHVGYDQRPENPRLQNPHQAAHSLRSFGSMYRQAYPYRLGTEEGLFFLAFSRSLQEIDLALDRMSGHFDEDGLPDNLFKFTHNVEGNYYYVPSLQDLANLPKQAAVSPAQAQSALARNAAHYHSTARPDVVRIFIEYCTNCGYKSIYNEKKRALEAVSPRVVVVPNPIMPRLSAFEITLEDGEVLWSKLAQVDGRNNYPHVFPTNEVLVTKLRAKLGLPASPENNERSDLLYQQEGTRVGVW